MRRNRPMSFTEAATNIVGYVLAIATQIVVFPWVGIETRLGEYLSVGLAFAGVSPARPSPRSPGRGDADRKGVHMNIGHADPFYINCAHLYRDHPDCGGIDHVAPVERLQGEFGGRVPHGAASPVMIATLAPVV